MPDFTNKALFLDRDGVVNDDVGFAYLPSQIRFVDGIFELCRAAKSKGYLIVIVTNQSGIGRGYYSEEDFHLLMTWMKSQFSQEKVAIDAVYYCPHHPQAVQARYLQICDCRKPKPGMLLAAQREHRIDVTRSIMIGDKPTDMEAAQRAGVGRAALLGQTIASLGEVLAWL